jgi:archaellum component FlaC
MMDARVWKRMLAAIAVAVCLGALGCSEDSGEEPRETTTLEDVGKEASEVAETAVAFAVEKRDEAAEALSTRIDKVEEDLAKLKARADKGSGTVIAEFKELSEGIEKQIAAARHELGEARNAADEAWSELAKGVSKAIDNLEEAYRDAVSQLAEDAEKDEEEG